MKEDLPRVYANKIERKLNNTQDIYYQNHSQNVLKNDSKTINKKIAEMFNSVNFIYKKDAKITINGRTITKTIVGRKNNFLLTMDNDAINIDEITNIEVI